MGHSPQIRSASTNHSLKAKDAIADFDYEPCFRYLKPIFVDDDLTIGNLEVTLSDKGKYSGYPRFKSPDRLAYDLKNAGFDVLTTANNHSNDNGLYGLIHTLDQLDSIQIKHLGTYRNLTERNETYPFIHIIRKNNIPIKIGFLNYTYGTNGLPTTNPGIVNLIDTSQMRQDIQQLDSAEVDVSIALIHWGSEYKLNESQKQRNISQFLQQQGIDVIVGAHPHVAQPIKKEKFRNKTIYVAYSLGNFISNQQQANTDVGLLYQLQIEKNIRSEQTTVKKQAFLPTWRYIHFRANKKKVFSSLPYLLDGDSIYHNIGLHENNIIRLKNRTDNIKKHIENHIDIPLIDLSPYLDTLRSIPSLDISEQSKDSSSIN